MSKKCTVYILIKKYFSPGWCGSVDWAPACEPKGRQFDSQSGHKPGLQARFLVGDVWEAIGRCISHTSMFLSLSFSLPSHFSKNKFLKIFTKINKIKNK